MATTQLFFFCIPHVHCNMSSEKYWLLPSATKLRRLCFYTCLSFCSQGGGLPQCMLGYHHLPPRADTHPQSRPPGAGIPPSRHPSRPGTTPPEQAPPRAGTPAADTPLGSGTPPADGYCCGRYASYRNALLFGGENVSEFDSHNLAYGVHTQHQYLQLKK